MLNPRPRLIRLTLLEGDPDGIRSVAIAGSTTVVTCCPISRISSLKQREESARPAIYMLSGESDGSEAIYIGECDSLVDRFRSKHHAMDKADWQQIALASTTDETFNKAHARRAEHLLVEIARSMRRVDVMTDQTSPGKLSDGDAAFAQDFVEDVALLAEIVGIRIFRGRDVSVVAKAPLNVPPPTVRTNIQSDPIPPATSADVFRFVGGRDLQAQMQADGAKFVVLAGAELRKAVAGACPPSALVIRAKLEQAGLFEQHPTRDGYWRLKADVPVNSTSAAAGLLTGSSLRGPHVWEHEASRQRYDVWLEAAQKMGGQA